MLQPQDKAQSMQKLKQDFVCLTLMGFSSPLLF